MPEPAPLDVGLYLVPISEASPSGESLRYEEDYSLIERAREEEPEVSGDDTWRKRNPKKADWEAVITLGLKALKEKTKDIEIAAWVAEALCRRRGLAGLRDGLRLVRAIQDTFWETAHPSDGDLELREGVYDFLDDEKRLPLLIRSMPIVSVYGLPPYSHLKYKESREVKNLLLKRPELREEIEKDGKVLDEDFDKATDATDRFFYVGLVERLEECLEATKQLNQSIRADEHYGKRGPTLNRTIVALEEVADLARQLLGKKPGGEPVPEPMSEPEGPNSPWPDDDGSVEGESPEEEAKPSWESSPPEISRPSPSKARANARSGGRPISDAEDAKARIAEAAHFLRQADPDDPVSYLVVRSMAMGGLYRSPVPIDPSSLSSPSSEDRQALRRLANEGEWAQLLERAELVLGRPDGAGWLDARRFALRALAEIGRSNVERASKAILGAELRDYPDWPSSELDDGTPCAGNETRTWIEDTFPATEGSRDRGSSSLESDPTFGQPGDFPDHPDGDRPLDPWDRAREFHRSGRSREAIALIGQAARDSRTGRERFLRTFQQAELCLLMGRPGVALPLLEGLARQIDELHLDRWEDPALCARVVAAFYQCVKGKDEARAKAIYDRLCQLDLGQALGLGDGPDA